MVIKCDNGHWFDSVVSKTCPHCKRNSEKLNLRLDDIEEEDKTVSITEIDLSLGEELGTIIGNRVRNSDSYDSINSGEDDDKTISFGFFGVSEIQPVVGWLVCQRGNEKGKDFRLHTGKNFVGRSTSMDVVLVDDKTISRERHCSVIYEPKKNKFYVSGEKGNLIYLNGEPISEPKEIRKGDRMTVGETELLFVPYCEESRKWEIE